MCLLGAGSGLTRVCMIHVCLNVFEMKHDRSQIRTWYRDLIFVKHDYFCLSLTATLGCWCRIQGAVKIIQHFVTTPAWEMERNIGHEHSVSSMSMWGQSHDPPWAQTWELETFKTSSQVIIILSSNKNFGELNLQLMTCWYLGNVIVLPLNKCIMFKDFKFPEV